MSQLNVRAIRHHLPPQRRAVSTSRGVALFTVVLFGYLTSFVLTALTPWWPVQLLGVVPLFFCMCWLQFLGHDAGHGSLTASPALNEWLGRLAFLPGLIPYSGWIVSHNKLHHAFTNIKGLDPMWAPLSKAEYDRLPAWRRWLERCYRTVPGTALCAMIEWWWKSMILLDGSGAQRKPRPLVVWMDRLFVVASFLTQLAVLLACRLLAMAFGFPLTPWPVAILACVVFPFVVMMWWAGFIGFLHHTHPRVRWYADRSQWSFFRGQVEATVHVEVPWWVDKLMGHSLDHTAHHVDPGVPLTALPECQTILEQAFEEVVRYPLTWKNGQRILATCQLYDYETHRWLDFDGNPTT